MFLDTKSDKKAVIWLQDCENEPKTASLRSYMAYNANEHLASISYAHLFTLVEGIASQLHQMLPKGDDTTQFPIAVAISSSSVYSCLAIGAVHRLSNAVLVPVDPRAAYSRHILSQVRPHVILVQDSDVTEWLPGDNPQAPLVSVADDCQVQCCSTVPRVVQVSDLILNIGKSTLSPLLHTDQPSLPLSHICYTSGTTTGIPKGCMVSRQSLANYLEAKNAAHGIAQTSVVWLASAIAFDPCLSDVLATWTVGATLALDPISECTHVLTTPTVFMDQVRQGRVPANIQMVALGGEPISTSLQATSWPLHATYGVTEACVYQTMSKVRDFASVGAPLQGMQVSIHQDDEVILSGKQLDKYSGYFGMDPDKFFQDSKGTFCYRTGDRGYLNDQGELVLQGRMDGDSMVKWNGMRIELEEIESTLVDRSVVEDCMVVGKHSQDNTSHVESIVAYVLLTRGCLRELTESIIPNDGVLCSGSPLLSFFQELCRLGSRVVPSCFVLIPFIPKSPNGKRSRKHAPSIEDTISLDTFLGLSTDLLSAHSEVGALIAKSLAEMLNLLPSQESLITTAATYTQVGGDSLTATRVTRALYAHHLGVKDSRNLFGTYGQGDGPFAVCNLLTASSLGEYADFIASSGMSNTNVSGNREETTGAEDEEEQESQEKAEVTVSSIRQTMLYDAVIQAIASGHETLAVALLELPDTNPNLHRHSFRIGKTSSRKVRQKLFRASPMHTACQHGLFKVVSKLLEKACPANSPDAGGNFPLLQVLERSDRCADRLQCLDALIQAGSPLTMKNANKQTILHIAARSGNCKTMRHVLDLWQKHVLCHPRKKDSLEWRGECVFAVMLHCVSIIKSHQCLL